MKTQEPADSPPGKPKRSCTKCGCILAVILGVLVVAGFIGFRMFFKSQFTPAQWEQMKVAETEIIQLPPEWHQPATLPPAEVVEFAHEFYPQAADLLTTHGELLLHTLETHQDLLQRMRLEQEVTPQERTSISLFMGDMRPLIKMSSATVQIPGYTMDLDLASPANSFLALQTFSKYAAIAALAHLHEGDAVLAVETATLPLRLTKRPEPSNVINHIIAVAVSAISAHTLFAIADATTDTAALQRGAELMEELEPLVFVGDISHWRYGDMFSSLRFAAANGYTVNLEPQPMTSLVAQMNPIINGHYYMWITKNLPADDPRVAGAQERLAQMRRPPIDYEKMFKIPDSPDDPFPDIEETSEQEQLELEISETTSMPKLQLALSKAILGVHPGAMLLAIANPNYDETEARARVAMAFYELTQIHFARRLAEVRGEKPTQMAEWIKNVPGVNTQLRDPFTSKPYKYNAEIDAAYSVGPDKEDDSAKVIYDATNGTYSGGDVWMNRK